MEDALGHRYIGFVAEGTGGAVEGVLPLVRMRSLLFGDSAISMPFLNYGGPVGTQSARLALVEAAERWAREQGVDRLELRCRAPLDGVKAAPRKVTVIMDLPPVAETLWSDLKSKVRSQVRRPMKEGMETRFGADLVDDFYDVFAVKMRDLGTPVLPRALFRALPRALSREVEFAVVYHDGLPVAGGCGFRFNGEFEMTWASSLPEFNRLAPNMLLYWAFMERMVEEGVSAFNFGRCTPGSGTHRFKHQWGGVDQPLPWIERPDDPSAAGPRADQGVYALATSMWRRLPVPLANLIGPPIARRLPTF